MTRRCRRETFLLTTSLLALAGPSAPAGAQEVTVLGTAPGASPVAGAVPGTSPVAGTAPAQVAACHPPMASCGEHGACVDPQTDVYNCGACGNVCADGLMCRGGACVESWEIGFGLEGGFHLGTGGLFGPGRDSFAPNLWALEEPFGSGLNVGFDLALRWGGFGVGLRYELQQYGAEADDYMADTLFLETRYLPFVRTYLGEWLLGSMHASIYADIELGYAGLSVELDDHEQLSVGQLVAGGRLGFALAVVDRLQVGVEAGLASHLTLTVETAGGSEIESEEMEGAWQLGVVARYTLPFELHRPPRPPPPPPPAPPPAYVLVVSSFEAATRESTLPEVTETDAYRARRGQIRRVAVAAPSNCADERASEATGQAQATGEVLATRCGVEMAELERALTRRGYIVTSWRTIAQYTDRVPLEVAEDLGAEVLFQINSLERTRTAAATDAELVRAYFASDAHGQRGPPIELTDVTRGQLRQLAQGAERSLAGQALPGAMLDANAIDVATGQTLWLYRWQTVYRDAARSSTETLAMGEVPEHMVPALHQQGTEPTMEMRSWRPVPPQPLPGVAPAGPVDTRQAVERSDLSTSGGPTDPARDVHFRLVRRIIDDFVSRFQTGQGSAPEEGANDAQ